ncbi:carbohydrate ABC transporter permease [Brenneria izadpanahii]|uniref:Carbohydrate ABC transporter permease n=1 Tax=Brenneria izadpanahii TaxID=2722756 RepID=A0ABX7UWH8_9GAMM|nr:carbohydrate ABC transporter permease [Brenneria izadpanahii]QTF08692.1 carbohydrate ABC transporter permease [Brenneria izadpanahii]
MTVDTFIMDPRSGEREQPRRHERRRSPGATRGLRASTVGKHLLLTATGLIMAFPFIWMLSGALKSNDEIFSSPLNLIPQHFRFSTFVDTFHRAPFGLYIYNSFSVALITTLLVIVNSSLFAYAITQFKFRSRAALFFIVMGCYMIPGAVTYIPAYIILSHLHLLDTHTGLILSNTASVFGVFYLRQVFLKVHPSLVEAARIDGAGELKILYRIVLPQCKAALATLFLITFITNYNSYMWPGLVITSQDLSLISAGVRQFFIADGNYGLNWSQVMAASAIAVLPLLLLFILSQKIILSGIADNGVKE